MVLSPAKMVVLGRPIRPKRRGRLHARDARVKRDSGQERGIHARTARQGIDIDDDWDEAAAGQVADQPSGLAGGLRLDAVRSLRCLLRGRGVWSELTGEPEVHPGFEVEIVAPDKAIFRALHGVPVAPDAPLSEAVRSDVVIVPDINLDIGMDPRGRWAEAARWIADRYSDGATICAVCTGSILVADTGLLDDWQATTHWAAVGLFETFYPAVDLKPERVLVHSGPDQRLITSGGAASWEDLALYLIGRHCGQQEAVRIAKVFLFGDRSDGQLAYAALTRPRHHDDAPIADCQTWLADHYAAANPVTRMVERSGLAERTFKRRFRTATGYAPIDYVQTIRIEEAKQLLETTSKSTDEIAVAIGYSDPAYFRKLFKRRTGVSPARYRQKFCLIGRPDRGVSQLS